MARNRPSKAVEPTNNSVVASASRYGGKIAPNFTKIAQGSEWQEQAWKFYDCIGEYRYSCDWVGNMLSKGLLHATIEVDGKAQRVEAGTSAASYINRFFGDSDGRAEMLRLIGIHMTVAGECWILSYPDLKDDDDLRDEFMVVAGRSLSRRGVSSGAWLVNNEPLLESNGDLVAEDDVVAIRIWRPHPKRPNEAVSPSRAILPILGEIYRLTEHVAAQVDSRLAGAGILLLPTEMQFPAPPAQPAKDGEPAPVQRVANNAEDLMGVLQEAMQTSIEDRSEASALVPIVITAPAEAIAAVKHMKFWTDLDEHAIELRNEAIRRLALGMDMPPEVLQGISESNHWSAWQADESAIKAHTEPLLKMVTTAIAKGWLRPLMVEEVGMFEADAYSIGVDTAEMRLRPNRSKEAMELYDRGLLSGTALLRETGFDDDDAISDIEYGKWVLRKLADGSATPELVEAALRALNVPIGAVEDSTGRDTPNEARPAPSLADHPEVGTPNRELGESRKDARQEGRVPSATDVQHASLIAAADQLVIRALERSGNKLKNKLQTDAPVAAFQLYRVLDVLPTEHDKLLDDAWTHVPALAFRYNISPMKLEEALDTYCRGLFENKAGHLFEQFSAYMEVKLNMMGAKA